MLRALALAGIGLASSTAGAHDCPNPCWLDPGQMCAGSASGRGFVRLGELAKPVSLVVERHPGSCGGVQAIDPAKVTAQVADQPGGPFSPATVTHDAKHVLWQPVRAGDAYLKLAEEGHGGDARAMVRVAETLAETKLKVAAPAAGHVEIRALPADARAALEAGFTEHDWPFVYAGEEITKAATPVRLAPGRYQARWSGEHGIALAPFEVRGEPERTVELPASSLRVTGKPPSEGWLMLVVDSDAGVSEHACFDREQKSIDQRLFLPPGKLRVQWFRGGGACPFRRPTGPISDEKLTLEPKSTVSIATSGAERR